jgi:ArsR family metal-binding transcriptional regulator
MIDLYLDVSSLNRILPCLAELGKIIVIGDPSRDLELVMPYLANIIESIDERPESG